MPEEPRHVRGQTIERRLHFLMRRLSAAQRARAAAYLETFGRRAGIVKRNLWRASGAGGRGGPRHGSGDHRG